MSKAGQAGLGTHEIRAKRDQGFWRCGRHFTKGWEPYNQADFTEAEWERITNEPQLMVRPLAEKGEAGPTEDEEAGGEAPPADLPEEGAGGDDPPAPEATLRDGRPRCQHVFDSGNQCTRAAVEGAAYCEAHLPDHTQAAEE